MLPMLTRELVPHLNQESEVKVCVDIISDLLVTLNRTDVVSACYTIPIHLQYHWNYCGAKLDLLEFDVCGVNLVT